MRRRLIAVFVAVSTLVAVAFVVPLGFLVKRTAEDRAIDAARADAAAIVPALVSSGTRAQIESAFGATVSGREGRMSVVTSQGWTIGDDVESVRIDQALQEGTSAIGPVDGGVEVVAAVATGPGELSAIRVFVDDAALQYGQWRAWGVLAAVGVVLVGISVVVADRLARTIVRPTEELADAARLLGQGKLDVTVQPSGPPELLALGGAFNELGSLVGSMLERERELIAELSHRLRTPLTKLRMRIDQVDDADLAVELANNVTELTAVVNQLINEARGSLGSPDQVEQQTCDAAAVVTDRAEFWSVLAEDQQRPWRFERGLGSLRIALSAHDLAAAVDVLLDNVFAHTEEGVALAVGFERTGTSARIWVEDGGDGMATDDLVRGESTAEGTGLGLAIARRTVEGSGGSLELGVGKLGGAAVALVFPIVDN